MRKLYIAVLFVCAGCGFEPATPTDIEEKYCGSIIMEQTSVFATIKTPDKKYVRVRLYEIHYRKYKAGDTVTCQ